MKVGIRTLTWLLAGALLMGPELLTVDAKSYSSGGGKSYSSSSSRSSSSRSSSSKSSSSRSSSSRSSSSSGSKSSGSSKSSSSSRSSSSSSGSTKSSGSSSSSSRSSSGSSSKSSGGSQSSRESGSSSDSRKTFTSSERKSYSSRPTGSDNDRRGYSSSKSYSSGSDRIFSSTKKTPPAPAKQESSPTTVSSPSSDEFNFDTAAARARKEEASKADYTKFKERSSPPPAVSANDSSDRVQPPPISATRSERRTVYVPTVEVIRTRPGRVETIFRPYYSRPVVVYQDRYDSLFWWWLLDRSLDDRARWAYHHRYEMDPARYGALVSADQQLAARVADLEAQEVARDPGYVPVGVDRDLMYSDQFVATSYSNRPTRGGRMAFWLIGVPAAISACWFFIWLIWFKRWQTST